jgi:hypothetical protein
LRVEVSLFVSTSLLTLSECYRGVLGKSEGWHKEKRLDCQ